MAMSFLVFGAALSRGADLTRISNETGVPVATLQAERTSTGLGWGGLEKAHLLANASGQSFDTITGKFQGGEGLAEALATAWAAWATDVAGKQEANNASREGIPSM